MELLGKDRFGWNLNILTGQVGEIIIKRKHKCCIIIEMV